MLDRYLLPSEDHRNLLASRVLTGLSRVKPELQLPTMDALGDLGLALATYPVAAWHGTLEDFARLCADGRPWPEATAAVELAAEGRLLEQRPDGRFRPDMGTILWLAARRTAATEDAAELMDHRLRGVLFDIFALAAAHTDEEESIGLLEVYTTRPGPFEERLHLGAALAAQAIAWGASAAPHRHGELLRQAFEWTGVEGLEHLRGPGTALLVREARRGPHREEVVAGSRGRLDATLEQLADPELAGHPLLLATLDADLAIAAAAARGETGRLEDLFDALSGAYAARLGVAIARVVPPGPRKNALLQDATARALALGDPEALSVLDALVEPFAGAIGPIHDVFNAVLGGDEELAEAARGGCRAVAHWRTAPELTTHLISRLVVSAVDPEVRIAAAQALSRHPKAFGPARQSVMDTLEASFGDDDALTRTAAVGAALHLGTSHPHAPALVLGLLADGVPASVLGPALADGLRQSPEILSGLLEAWERWGDEEPIQIASLHALDEVGESALAEQHGGAYFTMPPFTDEVRGALLKYVLQFAGDLERPQLAGHAAIIAGRLGRGDRGLARALRSVREQATEDQARALYNLALGACGVSTEDIVDLLGRDAASGAPNLSAAAAVALSALFDTRAQAQPLAPLMEQLGARQALEGPQQQPLLDLLHRIATLPLGG